MGKKVQVAAISPSGITEMVDLVEKSMDMAGTPVATQELWDSEFKAFLDSMTLKSLFFSESWVFIVIDLIASKISSQPLQIKRKVKNGGKTSYEVVEDHALTTLFEQPNQWQDYAQWMYNVAVELFLMGNSIIWHAPRTGQLIPIPTESIALDVDAYGGLRSYLVGSMSDSDVSRFDKVNRQQFAPKDIIHVRRTNPSSLLWGLSPFTPGRKSVLFDRYSTDYLNAFYLKQATPGLALTLDRQVNEDVALRQLRSFEVAYQGRKNQRRTLILPKGVDVKTLTHSLSDQGLIELINQNRETICGLLKVPKHEIGLQTAGSLGSEEFRVALRNFWESTLKPGCKLISGMLTKFFAQELGEGAYIEFDLSDVEALKDDLKHKADTATQMLQSGLSVNEVRKMIWEVEASDDPKADEPFVLAQSPEITPGVVAIPEEEAPSETLMVKLKDSDRLTEIREIQQKQLDTAEESTIKGLASKAIDLLVDMTGTALEVVEKSNKLYSSPRATKALPEDKVLRRRIQRALDAKFEEDWQNEVARTLSSSVEFGYDTQLEMIFNANAKEAVQALRERDAGGRRLILSARGLDSFAGISKTHTDRIMGQIAKGTQNGESITQIMRRVAEALGTPGQLAGKAEMIARTETLTAVSIGQAAALENAKEVIPGLRKAWLTAGDDRVRGPGSIHGWSPGQANHRALDGEVVPVDKKFSNGLRHPRDIQATDPGEVIQCRCTVLLLQPGDNLEI